jgi:hypothetical protein
MLTLSRPVLGDIVRIRLRLEGACYSSQDARSLLFGFCRTLSCCSYAVSSRLIKLKLHKRDACADAILQSRRSVAHLLHLDMSFAWELGPMWGDVRGQKGCSG